MWYKSNNYCQYKKEKVFILNQDSDTNLSKKRTMANIDDEPQRHWQKFTVLFRKYQNFCNAVKRQMVIIIWIPIYIKSKTKATVCSAKMPALDSKSSSLPCLSCIFSILSLIMSLVADTSLSRVCSIISDSPLSSSFRLFVFSFNITCLHAILQIEVLIKDVLTFEI